MKSKALFIAQSRRTMSSSSKSGASLADAFQFGCAPHYFPPFGVVVRGHFGALRFPTRYGGRFHFDRDGVLVKRLCGSSGCCKTDASSSPIKHLIVALRRDHGFLVDGCASLFEEAGDDYDDTLHCIQHLDQELRRLAWIPQARVAPGWQCAVYINALSQDGVAFSVPLNGREPKDAGGEDRPHCTRHARIIDDARAPGVWNVTLEYVLLVWLGKEPTSKESASPSEIDQKVLVLLCDFYNSHKWVRQLEAWTSRPDTVPESIADRWDELNVVVVGLEDDTSVCVAAKSRKFTA